MTSIPSTWNLCNYAEIDNVDIEQTINLNKSIINKSFVQYYSHKERLKKIGREDDSKELNLKALAMAREVADRTGSLMAGNICNSTIYEPDRPDIARKIRNMFKVWNHAKSVIKTSFKSLCERQTMDF